MVFFLFGVISWILMEYGIHRLWLHNDEPFHRLHHETPLDKTRLHISLSFSLPLMLGYWLFAFILFGGAGAFFATSAVLLGYFFYEYVHYSVHHLKSRNGLIRYLKKHHLIHHFKDETKNFGVTSPVADYLFGTKL